MAFAPRESMKRVAEARKTDLNKWEEGVRLERLSGHSIEELRHRAAADRLRLSAELATRARQLAEGAQTSFRDAVSRAYYSMYHSWRAVVYFESGGDDNQEHKTVAKYSPAGFADVAIWQNTLKTARETRNRADYEPYPKADSAWRTDAVELCNQADDLLRLARRYLRQGGCNYL
jgi:uncharacterized protein (UPF0332 family)